MRTSERQRLIAAAGRGSLGEVRDLLERASATQTDLDTALPAAAERGQVEVMTLLLDRGADVEAVSPRAYDPELIADTGSQPCLHLAAQAPGPEAVRLLLERGADIHQTDGLGRTALMVAARTGRLETVKLLLQQGSRPNTLSLCGSALRFAVLHGHREVARYLVRNGADIHARSRFGFSPLKSALRHADPRMLAMLQFDSAYGPQMPWGYRGEKAEWTFRPARTRESRPVRPTKQAVTTDESDRDSNLIDKQED